MIKKHLIACSALFFALLLSKFLLTRTSGTQVNQFPQNVDLPSPETKPLAAADAKRSFEFASEKLPLGNKKVAWKLEKYLRAHHFQNVQTHKLHRQAERWFPIIEPILKLYGVPEDFKYIPLVESGMAGGTSNRGASGYWQFMPRTARDFGLEVNGQVDERKNMRKSTIAACKYLRSLYREFGNWTLVAAAYNLGENKIKKQMNRQKQYSYYRMKLNRETSSYVYKLVSMKEIIEDPVRYGYAGRGRLLAYDAARKPKRIDFSNPTGRGGIQALSVLSN
jgi:membrane-bound lytic murein transglycosylase D